MIPNQLKFRTKFIKATPEPKRACVKSFSRREISNVLPKEEEHYSDKFDSFFEYEKELSDMEPSGRQYAESLDKSAGNNESTGFTTMEELNSSSKQSPVIMQDVTKEEGRSHMTMESVGPNNEAKFEFKQCIYEINEGRQCKRQAPKKSNFCSSHRNKTR